jgi:hypothetical protein
MLGRGVCSLRLHELGKLPLRINFIAALFLSNNLFDRAHYRIAFVIEQLDT